MLIDKDDYLSFCLENIDRAFPQNCKDFPSHEPNIENFEKWISLHNEGEPRETAIRFRDATRYVSLCEFLDKYQAVCEDISNHISTIKYDTVIFYLNTENFLRKSNFWLSIHLFTLLYSKVTIITDRIEDVNIIQMMMSSQINNKTLLILPDDASYSGSQISNLLRGLTSENRIDVLLAVAFISDEAVKRIEHTTSNVKNIMIAIPDNVEKMQKFHLPKSISYTGERELYTVYFDHKLPDEVSIYQFQYGIGKGFGRFGIDYTYKPLSLISGCDIPRMIDIDYRFYDTDIGTMKADKKEILNTEVIARNEKQIADLADLRIFQPEAQKLMKKRGVSPPEMCPQPIYKTIQYLFHKKPIKDLSKMQTSFTYMNWWNENGKNIAKSFSELPPPTSIEFMKYKRDYLAEKYPNKNTEYKTLSLISNFFIVNVQFYLTFLVDGQQIHKEFKLWINPLQTFYEMITEDLYDTIIYKSRSDRYYQFKKETSLESLYKNDCITIYGKQKNKLWIKKKEVDVITEQYQQELDSFWMADYVPVYQKVKLPSIFTGDNQNDIEEMKIVIDIDSLVKATYRSSTEMFRFFFKLDE